MKNLTKKSALLALMALAVVMNFTFMAPAKADDGRGRAVNMIHHDEWQGRGRGRGEEAHEREWREHEEEARRWHHRHREPEPTVIYAPPAAYYEPPPPSGVNLFIPFDIR